MGERWGHVSDQLLHQTMSYIVSVRLILKQIDVVNSAINLKQTDMMIFNMSYGSCVNDMKMKAYAK